MPNYSFPLYRPPAEADNIIIQATYGCSYNGCSFCSMYKSKKYVARTPDEVRAEIDTLAGRYPDARRVFLADGDALSLPTEHLLELLQYLKRAFPKLGRLSSYANAQNLLEKSETELRSLKEAGLTLIYYGIESGSDTVLEKINKGVTSGQIVDSLNKAHKAGMKISATVILGIGGEEHTHEHIRDTVAVVNATTLNYLSTLQLGLDGEVKATFLKRFGDFTMLDDTELLDEQKRFLQLLNPSNRVIFRSNHASNALHLSGTLPNDTPKLMREIDAALAAGEAAFVPKYFRGF
jgi:coproporphyrinogen III oxidase-like Fe-S oxidoreductase